jgi:hypothetical protein
MDKLISSITVFTDFVQKSVHGAFRANVDPFVEQNGHDLGRRQVHKLF